MYMLGHHHVAHDNKMVPESHPLQHFEKQVAIRAFAEECAPLVTTGSDKVQASGAVVTTKSTGHSGQLT
jgi:hypothetical protein